MRHYISAGGNSNHTETVVEPSRIVPLLENIQLVVVLREIG